MLSRTPYDSTTREKGDPTRLSRQTRKKNQVKNIPDQSPVMSWRVEEDREEEEEEEEECDSYSSVCYFCPFTG